MANVLYPAAPISSQKVLPCKAWFLLPTFNIWYDFSSGSTKRTMPCCAGFSPVEMVAQAVSESGGKVERTFNAVARARSAEKFGSAGPNWSSSVQSRASMPRNRIFIGQSPSMYRDRALRFLAAACVPGWLARIGRRIALLLGGSATASTSRGARKDSRCVRHRFSRKRNLFRHVDQDR